MPTNHKLLKKKEKEKKKKSLIHSYHLMLEDDLSIEASTLYSDLLQAIQTEPPLTALGSL